MTRSREYERHVARLAAERPVAGARYWRAVNGGTALEWVGGEGVRLPRRGPTPLWQRIAWWIVAVVGLVAMSGTFGRGW